ncbi:ornithine cyclodeaminase family protein [Pseudodesulfovibrio sp.]|uniref:ornithine cyclodeaminase family protein n=1 Tax=unclassified Pseudodesulfovibrio TaxID=2661612 RepID=UPI003B007993
MTTEVLWLPAREIDALHLSMKKIMDCVEEGFTTLGRGEGELPPKIGIHPRENAFIHAMPCYLGGKTDRAGIKCVSAYPANPAKGLPYIAGLMLLLDPETGLPQAVMDAGWVTAWRTGAASGVYARHFGNPATKTISMIGTGTQARLNLLALREVFPQLASVRCFNIREKSARTFMEEMGPKLPEIDFRFCAEAQDAVRDADVVVSCTPMSENPKRFIKVDWLRKDALSIAVDYDAAFEADVFQNAHFTCDNRNQYVRTQEAGIYFQGGYPGPNDIDADLGDVCAGTTPGIRTGRRGAVLMGIASHDVMTADLIYQQALAKGAGTKVEL